ncbi:HD-GYP domain-containing protein [Psychrobium sp. 1_MG-2023]|uniref:HD-GYP domain-containing protein n=1 Tax=Psychrobium sp. 1_MG-2023 TaxID=3062624 RepID=UPI000C33A186|nr:HD domain-containing phosphohydrolase [Psychrobium sp. 1_MG-2023]MDP2560930.1 HD domain-containing phosphohydrolase [Psychrobium sp. 1_MG-2023]PKF56002.1 hypothetical protein CW748_11325 [Alteromonadales bacterium alter-6D02]
MTQQKEQSLVPEILQHQQQLDHILTISTRDVSSVNSKKLNAHLTIFSDWLWHLAPDNIDAALGFLLHQTQPVSAACDTAFKRAVITRKLAEQLKYHAYYAQNLIKASLILDLGLNLNGVNLSEKLRAHQALTTQEKKVLHQSPIISANFCHKQKLFDTSIIYGVMEHKERLDGSGYPKRRSNNQLRREGKLLAIVHRVCELLTATEKRPAYSIKQALGYLAKHPQHFCSDILRHVVVTLDKPHPAMSLRIDKKTAGLIESIDYLEQKVRYFTYQIEHPLETLAEQVQIAEINKTQQYFIEPRTFSTKTLTTLLEQHNTQHVEDNSEKTSRLQPSMTLQRLLDCSAQAQPDQALIEEYLSQLPTLGESFVNTLTTLYPNSQFNSSLHAFKMAGAKQARPLLSQLALQNQLSEYFFPALPSLDHKVTHVIKLSREVAQYARNIEPNQLAMFSLINLAPLYFERKIHQLPARSTVDITACYLHHGFSLFGLNNSQMQVKIATALIKHWDKRATNLNALRALSTQPAKLSKQEQELIDGYQLALLLTHHTFHGVSLQHKQLKQKLALTCRTLSIKKLELTQLINFSLDLQPMCEL